MTAAASSPPAAAPRTGVILVVDDDRLVLATVAHGLAQAGYTVIDADNGDDAILLARQHRPDLALLDIRMEGLSGFDVAAYLRESLGTPFLFLSAFADDDTLARVRELGAVAYLVKPLDIAQIIPTVDAALATSRRQRVQPAAAAARPAAAAATATAATIPVPESAARSAAASALGDPVPLAVGVLMHRYSLPRQEALARLTNLASANACSVPAQAASLLDAVELLAQPAR